MIKARDIEWYVGEIVRRFKPQRVILFGSYAYGAPSQDSDVDLMVIKRHRGHPARAAARISIAIEHRFPLDLMVRSPSELRRRLAMDDYFISEIVHKGIVLYEEHDARVAQQGRRRFRRRLAAAALAQAQPV
jgi:predicted nucleotidyltransferase